MAAVLLACASWAAADPSSRVARLGYTSGTVSFSPAGETEWDRATLNRPLTAGDRLWVEAGARAEIEVGGAMLRLGGGTAVALLNLDDRIVQLQLSQGVTSIRLRRLAPGQTFEIDTPNLAFTLRQPGEYRIEVDPDVDATTIVVRKGLGQADGEGASYVIEPRQAYRFTGTGLRDYQDVDTPRPDPLERWAGDRDRAYDSSASARFVSADVVGARDLDAYGSWRVDANYGNVWHPTRVPAGWAPYRDGHWAWVDPWGWTWVDDAPWGFAVSHYGRWAHLGGSWAWVPGPARSRAYYAPALVVFVGGANFQLTLASGNVGGVAWFPLAPREVYRPAYPVSRGYFENVNRSNTVVNTTVINNTYNTYNTHINTNVTNVVYANRHVPGAVVAVPTTAFVHSQPVAGAAVKLSREAMVDTPVRAAPPLAPTEKSVRGAAGKGDKPPQRVFERHVVARTEPAKAQPAFTAQQAQLGANPGRPLDDAERNALKARGTAAPVPNVKLVAPVPQEVKTMRAPPPVPRATALEVRPPVAAHGPAIAPPPTQAQATLPAPPSPSPPPSRARPEPRGEQPRPPAAPPPPQAAAPRPPPATAAPPAAQHPPSAKDEPRAQPSKPVASAPPDKKRDGEFQARDDDKGKPKP